jgi:hypothetical protein
LLIHKLKKYNLVWKNTMFKNGKTIIAIMH